MMVAAQPLRASTRSVAATASGNSKLMPQEAK